MLAFCKNGTDLEKVRAILELFRDALFHIPASSVEVEKLHANTQRNCQAHKTGRSPHTVQQNSYVMSVAAEHRRLKQAVEDETLGVDRRSAGGLLHRRVASSTTPGKMAQGHLRQKSENKRETFMSKVGLGASNHAVKRKRRVTAMNVYQQKRMKGLGLKVGTPEYKARHQQICEDWARLSDADRARYVQLATEQTAAKAELASKTLAEAEREAKQQQMELVPGMGSLSLGFHFFRILNINIVFFFF